MQEAASDAAMMLDEDGTASLLNHPTLSISAHPVASQDSRGKLGQLAQLGEAEDERSATGANGARMLRRRSSSMIDDLMDLMDDDIHLDMLNEDTFYKMEI